MKYLRLLPFLLLTTCATLPRWQGSLSGEGRYGGVQVTYDGKTVRTDYKLPDFGSGYRK